MKPILIDDLIKESNDSTQSSHNVTVDGVTYTGYQIAKPLNYEPEYLSMRERCEMACAVLSGKAIAVRYFSDMTEEEQSEYVKAKL